MPKLILIFMLAFATSSETENTEKDTVARSASIIYSEPVIDFESGQPVFTTDVEPTIIRRSNQKGVKVTINDSLEVELFTEVIKISDLIELNQGTYTVMVEVSGKTEIFGFTVR